VNVTARAFLSFYERAACGKGDVEWEVSRTIGSLRKCGDSNVFQLERLNKKTHAGCGF